MSKLTDFEKAWHEIVDAYSDCNELTKKERNLDFKSEYGLDAIDLCKVIRLAIPGGYNEFNEGSVKRIVDFFGMG